MDGSRGGSGGVTMNDFKMNTVTLSFIFSDITFSENHATFGNHIFLSSSLPLPSIISFSSTGSHFICSFTLGGFSSNFLSLITSACTSCYLCILSYFSVNNGCGREEDDDEEFH
jgi:hypothetical protein